MLTFLFLVAAVLALFYVREFYAGSAGGRALLVAVAFAMMVGVAGVRNVSVGTDTENYVQFFESIDGLLDALAMGFIDNEYAFWILNWMAKLFSENYAALLTAVGVIVVGCYLQAILRNSCSPLISVFVFLTGGFYTFFFNGARQAIACAICAIAIRFLVERNLRKYLVLVVVATLFHKTAAVMLPLYFIAGSTVSFGRLVLYAVIGVAAALSLETIVAIGTSIDPRYADYAVSGEGGGFLMVAFNLALCAFFFLFRPAVAVHRNQYDVLLNVLIFGAIVSCISSIFRIAPSGILRLNLYFGVGTLFLWPIVFANLRASVMRLYLGYGFVVTYILFFTLSLARFGDLVPYTVNPGVALDLY